jgi:hypothetical protein
VNTAYSNGSVFAHALSREKLVKHTNWGIVAVLVAIVAGCSSSDNSPETSVSADASTDSGSAEDSATGTDTSSSADSGTQTDAGSNSHVISQTTSLTSLTIIDGETYTAPDGYSLTLTIDGIQMPIEAGVYSGDIV